MRRLERPRSSSRSLPALPPPRRTKTPPNNRKESSMQPESISLYFKEGSSDKEYHAQLESHDGGWIVNFQYGRRSSALRADSKTPQPLPYEEAKKIYDKVVSEKLGKGYPPHVERLPAPIGHA